MPLIQTIPEVLKGVTLIEIDRNQILVHDSNCAKDGWVEYTILPGRDPGTTVEDFLLKVETVAKDYNIPIRRRPHL